MSATTDAEKGFGNLVAVIDKFIRESSPFEVNIESRTRSDLLGMADERIFRDLSQVGAKG